MAVVAFSTSNPISGKETEAEALMKESLELMKSFGAKGHVNSLVMGGVPGTLSLVLEYADEAEFAASLDAAYSNKGALAFMERGRDAKALVPVRSIEYSELPGEEVLHDEIASSGVVVLSSYRIHHGKHDQVHEWMRHGKKISEKHGARVRLLHATASDATDEAASAIYFPSFAARTAHLKALSADKEWHDYGVHVARHAPAADQLRTQVLRVL